LYASNYGDLNFLFHNNGDGTFDEVAGDLHVDKPEWSFPAWFWDYDNDGWLDVFVASYSYSIEDVVRTFLGQPVLGETMKLYHNTGKGLLRMSVAFSNINNDGAQDVAVNIRGAVPGDKYHKSLFLNPGHANNWISVKLIGVKTNRIAIGARIKLKLAGDDGLDPFRYRYVTSGGSFGASSLAQNIGLEKARRIETLEVWWPTSNRRQTFKNVAVNQFIEIKLFDNWFSKLISIQRNSAFKVKYEPLGELS